MSENELEAIAKLFIDFKNEIRTGMDKKFDELKLIIEKYTTKTNGQDITITGMQKDVDNIGERLRDNFDQHTQFYEKFEKIENKLSVMDGKSSVWPFILSIGSFIVALIAIILKMI